jgi:hypothetical protein
MEKERMDSFTLLYPRRIICACQISRACSYVIKIYRYMIIIRSISSTGILHRFIPLKRSVIGVVRAIKKSEIVHPNTRKKMRTDCRTAFCVIVRLIHENNEKRQMTSPPPSMNKRTIILQAVNIAGASRSSPYTSGDMRAGIKRTRLRLIPEISGTTGVGDTRHMIRDPRPRKILVPG